MRATCKSFNWIILLILWREGDEWEQTFPIFAQAILAFVKRYHVILMYFAFLFLELTIK